MPKGPYPCCSSARLGTDPDRPVCREYAPLHRRIDFELGLRDPEGNSARLNIQQGSTGKDGGLREEFLARQPTASLEAMSIEAVIRLSRELLKQGGRIWQRLAGSLRAQCPRPRLAEGLAVGAGALYERGT